MISIYFDAIVRGHGDCEVLFNGTPEETKAYIMDVANVIPADATVMRGWDLKRMSASEYIAV